jgi:DNA-directed RNA polymerase subunit omega
MARITVEDCLDKIDSQYDLVLLAKERASQLNAGDKLLVPKNNDKNTVIALREIGEGKISIKTIEDNAINKLRKPQNEPTELEDLEMDEEDSFDKIYKGEVSKSGAAILPSKRARRIPEAIQPSPKVVSEQINIEADKEDQTIEENQPEIEEVVTPTPTEEKTE